MCGIRKVVLICCRLIVELIGTLSCVSVYVYVCTQDRSLDTDTCNDISHLSSQVRVVARSWYMEPLIMPAACRTKLIACGRISGKLSLGVT